MLHKTTRKLFRGIYQYKIVLVCAGAHIFRNHDADTVLDTLLSITLSSKTNSLRNSWIKTQEDLDYAFKLQNVLSTITDIDIRVESPWVSIYSNSKQDIDALAAIDNSHVKYLCTPPTNSSLVANTVIMPKMNYDFKVTLGKTTQEHTAFIAWAQSNKKCKLTKSCIRDLSKNRTWGGTHFYITGDNNLLMAKMHLAGSISKVEHIVKA